MVMQVSELLSTSLNGQLGNKLATLDVVASLPLIGIGIVGLHGQELDLDLVLLARQDLEGSGVHEVRPHDAAPLPGRL